MNKRSCRKSQIIFSVSKYTYRTVKLQEETLLSDSFFFLVSLGEVRLSPLGTSATVVLLYQPRMIGDYGAVGGMRIGRGNRSTRRKPSAILSTTNPT
jgi:hypothetical protein